MSATASTWNSRLHLTERWLIDGDAEVTGTDAGDFGGEHLDGLGRHRECFERACSGSWPTGSVTVAS